MNPCRYAASRDCRIHADAEKAVVTGGSDFDIKAASPRLGDFSPTDIDALLDQHAEATGQVFADAARSALWALTQGQLGLVNALAYEAGRERGRPVWPRRRCRQPGKR